LAADSAMTVTIEPAVGGLSASARLRDESFDVVLVQHAPAELDALEFVEGHRAGGFDDPFVVLGRHADHALAPLCYEVGADDYLTCDSVTPRQMIWAIGRAIQWRRLQRDNMRLTEVERNRLCLEHREAERLLEQQRGLVTGLEDLAQSGLLTAAERGRGLSQHRDSSAPSPVELPASLVSCYRDLLRAHVIMGSGNLASETAALVDSLAALDMPGPQVMQLHVHALEDALRGLGSRGSRHVMSRADLLVLEVMVQLAERYRKRRKGDNCDGQLMVTSGAIGRDHANNGIHSKS
jgi:CheY-like chemotaxis protein